VQAAACTVAGGDEIAEDCPRDDVPKRRGPERRRCGEKEKKAEVPDAEMMV